MSLYVEGFVESPGITWCIRIPNLVGQNSIKFIAHFGMAQLQMKFGLVQFPAIAGPVAGGKTLCRFDDLQVNHQLAILRFVANGMLVRRRLIGRRNG